MADIKKQIINKFNEAHNVAVFTHVRPDADAIGSCSALKMVLESQGKHVDLYCDSEISDRYNFIKYSDAFNKPTCTEYDVTFFYLVTIQSISTIIYRVNLMLTLI